MYCGTCGRPVEGYNAHLSSGNSTSAEWYTAWRKEEREKEKKNRSRLSKILFLDSTPIDALEWHNLQSRSTGDVLIRGLSSLRDNVWELYRNGKD